MNADIAIIELVGISDRPQKHLAFGKETVPLPQPADADWWNPRLFRAGTEAEEAYALALDNDISIVQPHSPA